MGKHEAFLHGPAVALAVALMAGAGAATAMATPPSTVPQADDAAAVAAYRARLQREIAEVKVEYDRRLARDGKASADAWLAEKAREMGRREGEAARRAEGR